MQTMHNFTIKKFLLLFLLFFNLISVFSPELL